MDRIAESKARWIFGSITILLLLPVVFIVGLVVGINFESTISLSQDNLSSWVTAFATVSIAVLTIVLARETWALRLIQLSQIEQIRKDSLKPRVSIYLKSNPAAYSIIDVHITNNGVGTAQQIGFAFKSTNQEAIDVYEYMQSKFEKIAILKNGISSLSSGEHRTSYVFNFVEIFQKFGNKSFDYLAEVDIVYEDIEGSRLSSKSYFNFAEYKGLTQVGGGDPLYKISSELEKMQKNLETLSKGNKRLKADIYTNADRQRESNAHKRHIDKIKSQHDGKADN